ncbi:MAG: HINT domain-containing protein [Chitinophagaceae bacterium]|nr:HINT domain-containing protein [Chitinophagaceae bacterium]
MKTRTEALGPVGKKPKKVVHLHRLWVGTDTLLTTPEHLFYSGGGWVAASALQAGMPVQAALGQATVVARKPIDGVPRCTTLRWGMRTPAIKNFRGLCF